MTYFLLVYNRRRQQLIDEILEFADADDAIRARFQRERKASVDGDDLEVVVLGAADRAALENTHSRYFGSGRELSRT